MFLARTVTRNLRVSSASNNVVIRSILVRAISHTKKKKDKNAPKGALSAYILFGTATRPQVKADIPGISSANIMKELGTRWKKALSAEEKAPFEKLAAADKERYTQELAAYNAKKATNEK